MPSYYLLFISVLFLDGIQLAYSEDDIGYFDRCRSTGYNDTTIPFTRTGLKRGVFRPECAPDVLYSWQRDSEIDWKNFGRNFLSRGELYTWRTPMGTFGYGDVQIRVKLRPNVRFRVNFGSRDCSLHRKTVRDSTVFIFHLQDEIGKTWFTDYLICSNKVAESWSTRTLGAALEGQREMNYILAHPPSATMTYDTYVTLPERKRISYIGNPNANAKNWNAYFPVIDYLAFGNAVES